MGFVLLPLCRISVAGVRIGLSPPGDAFSCSADKAPGRYASFLPGCQNQSIRRRRSSNLQITTEQLNGRDRVAAIVSASHILFEILRWAGVCYLVYLSVRMI